jgi:hypothetical protein
MCSLHHFLSELYAVIHQFMFRPHNCSFCPPLRKISNNWCQPSPKNYIKIHFNVKRSSRTHVLYYDYFPFTINPERTEAYFPTWNKFTKIS